MQAGSDSESAFFFAYEQFEYFRKALPHLRKMEQMEPTGRWYLRTLQQ